MKVIIYFHQIYLNIKPYILQTFNADFTFYGLDCKFIFDYTFLTMISAQQIRDILSLYAKFGWTLRRVLLSPQMKENLADSVQNIFETGEIFAAEIDAVWFSRASGKDNEAWELRRLSETPFALFEMFENDDEEAVREEIRHELEAKLFSSTAK